MKAEEIKIELISWIASLKQDEWLKELLEVKERFERDSKESSKIKSPNKAMRGYGSMKGEIWMAPDFDAPLDDFKDYM